MKFWKQTVLFYLGGCAYMVLELLWRGRTHGSMFLAGGTCFLLIGQLSSLLSRVPFLLRAVAGAGIVTAVELCAGLLFNRNYEVWDYRGNPGNFMGQICPMFTLLWIPVSVLAMLLYSLLQRSINRISDRACL